MRKSKAFSLLFFLCFPLALCAQKPGEIGLISDNDLYTSPIYDRYYTNGIELFYRYLGTSESEKMAKKITEIRAGQYMYNPQSVRAEDINVHDRPFAGYLFGEIGVNKFYRSEEVFKINFQVGVLGKESLAEGFQEQLHKFFGYPTVKGWEYQIRTTIGLQGNFFYSCKIFKERFKEKVDFHLQANMDVGTIWTGITVGPMMRISFKKLLLPVYNSALHGASLNHDRNVYTNDSEFFLFLNPNLNYQVYDATIQGSPFNDDSPVTFNLIPFRFNAEVGVKYKRNKWNLSYSFNYRGKELSNNVIEGYYYGSIVVGYML